MKLYHEIENIFYSWKRTKLALVGKSCIVNTLAISKLKKAATIPDKECITILQRLILKCFIKSKIKYLFSHEYIFPFLGVFNPLTLT